VTAGVCHAASIVIAAEAAAVFHFMRDEAKLHRWSFGTWQTTISTDGLVTGTSIFDGSTTLVRIDADVARLAIDYRLGSDPAALLPRIMARIVPGPTVGLGPGHAVLTLVAWRSAAMDDDRWRRLAASHDFEVVLIKNLIENGRA
jgi:hypothetical protein